MAARCGDEGGSTPRTPEREPGGVFAEGPTRSRRIGCVGLVCPNLVCVLSSVSGRMASELSPYRLHCKNGMLEV